MTLVRVVAPHFVAGFILEAGHVIEAAPIIRYMQRRRWTADQARRYLARKRWKAFIVQQDKAPCP